MPSQWWTSLESAPSCTWLLCLASAAALLLGGATGGLAACTKSITITERQQMNYGTIAVTSGGGTVTMQANGTLSAPAGFVLSGATATGRFRVNGSNNCNVSIAFVAGSLTGPGTAMRIQNFTTDAGANPILNGGGRLTFNVGAGLVVNSSQAGGNYSGSYTVTVIY